MTNTRIFLLVIAAFILGFLLYQIIKRYGNTTQNISTISTTTSTNTNTSTSTSTSTSNNATQRFRNY